MQLSPLLLMSETPENFWSIVLEPGSITAAVWTRSGAETRVLGIGQAIPWSETQELVASVDAALSSAVEELPDDTSEPNKTVFGVVPQWVEDGQIKKDQLTTLREITEKLTLTPIGFVVLPEALANEVKHSEGSPLTGVIIGITKDNLDVTLFKLGNLLGTVSVGRSMSIFDDVIEGLSRFKVSGDAMPSRFILYGAHDSEITEVKDTLVLSEWMDAPGGLTFLHIPQIIVAPSEKKAIALSLAGSTEMGEVTSLFIPKQDTEVGPENVDETEAPTEPDPELTNLGFVSEQDIANVRPFDPTPTPEAPVSALPKKTISGMLAPLFAKMTKLPRILPNMNRKPKVAPVHAPMNLGGAPHAPAKKAPHIALPFAKSGFPMPKVIAGVGGGILLLLVFLWWYVPSAEIVVYVSPQVLTGRTEILLDRDASTTDIPGRIVPAREVLTTLSASKSRPASGSKTTGERAKGTITIRNGTSVPVKLAQGAFVATSNDLRFALDESASVGAAISPTTPGSITVGVTAEQIGSNHNIASGESLKVSNYPKSEVDAIVESNGISGGTSREVVAVSKIDIDEATNELTTELKGQISAKLAEEVPEGNSFIPGSLTTTVSEKEVSAKVGDEASEVTVTITMEAQGVSIARADLTAISTDVLNPSVPQGFTLRPEQIDPKFTVGSAGSNPIEAELNLTARLLPNTDPDEIKRRVVGRRPAKIDEVLKTIPGFVRAQVTTTPKLPALLRVIPFRRKQVGIEVVAEQ